MTSFHVICGLGLPQSKILGTPMNWRSPEKKILKTFFFWRKLALVSLVLGLGLEHSFSWPREVLSSERLSLALASSLVSSTPPLLSKFPVIFSIFRPINVSFQRNASPQNKQHFGLFLLKNYLKMLEIIVLPTAIKAF